MKILVITTRELPTLRNGLYRPVGSVHMSNYCIGNTFMPQDIRHYLESYRSCSEHVSKFLKEFAESQRNECGIPLLKRQVSPDFVIYVTLCLDTKYSGYGDEACHGYLNAIIEDVISDSGEHDGINLLAHCMDVVMEHNRSGISRPVSKDELMNGELKSRLNMVSIYCHINGDDYYNKIITRLSESDDELRCLMTTLEN